MNTDSRIHLDPKLARRSADLRLVTLPVSGWPEVKSYANRLFTYGGVGRYGFHSWCSEKLEAYFRPPSDIPGWTEPKGDTFPKTRRINQPSRLQPLHEHDGKLAEVFTDHTGKIFARILPDGEWIQYPNTLPFSQP